MVTLDISFCTTLLSLTGILALLATPAVARSSGGWEADPGSAEWHQRHHAPMNFLEDRVPDYQLPPILRDHARRSIQTIDAWEDHRATLVKHFEQNIYGSAPGMLDQLTFDVTNTDPEAMDGRATLKQIEVRCQQDGRSFSFPCVLFVPNEVEGPAPVLLLINIHKPHTTDPTRQHKSDAWPAEEAIERGYAVAAFHKNDVAPDDPDRWRDGVVNLFAGEAELADDAWGAIAAWAWGASRVMDYIERDDRLDASRVAVVGHSRGGKAALWAGANDQRFALVIANNSGSTGAALARRRYGENVKKINDSFPHWFADNYRQYNDREDQLPVDQHQLIALVAPRAVYIASANEDLWADPRGEYLALAHASPAYELYGHPAIDPQRMPGVDEPLIDPPRGYHVAPGGHALNRYSWDRFMDFADQLWKN